jgi:hypothetical protein
MIENEKNTQLPPPYKRLADGSIVIEVPEGTTCIVIDGNGDDSCDVMDGNG